MNDIVNLKNCDLFDGVDFSGYYHLFKTINTYKKSSSIMVENDTGCHVFFVLKGGVTLTISSENGDVIAYNEVRKNDYFGWLSAFDKSVRITSAITKTDTVIAVIPFDDFRKIIISHPIILQNFMERVCGVIRSYTQRIEELTSLSVGARVVNELKRRADKSNVVTIESHESFAQWVGASRESVSRTLSRLEESGDITKDGKSYILKCLNHE